MADNIELNAGTGGATIATDDVGGAHHQYVKVEYGADGAATPVDATNCLPVVLKAETTKVIGTINVAAAQTIAVTNAGTFACQVDGAALTALQIIDDWDESDRCKVNPIAGQAGIAAGAGAVGVTVPRVTLASDDPAVTALQVLDNAISGSEMQVDVVGSLPAGTNLIGAVDLTKVAGASVAVSNGTADTSLRVTLASDSTGQVKLTTGTASIGYLAAGSSIIGKVSIDQVTANANEVVIKSITAGDTNIGNVDVASIAAGDNNIGNVDIVTQPARDRLTDNVGVALQTDVILSDTTALTPKFAAISANTSGDNVIVDAVADKKIRVLALMLYAYGTAVNAYLRSEATGSIFGSSSAPIILDKTGATGPAGFCLPFNPVGWCQTVAGEHLHLNLSAAQYVGGAVVYVEV